MPYVTGTANTLTELMTAVSNALTGNGYTQSGNVFEKSTLFVSIENVTTYLRIRGGTGKDGSNLLTGTPFGWSGGSYASYASLAGVGSAGNLSFPGTYFIHILTSPDEVYIFFNDDTDRYSWMAFGQSPVQGLPGTGNWYAASVRHSAASLANGSLSTTSESLSGSNSGCPGLFWLNDANGAPVNTVMPQNSFFHHGLDSGVNTTGWSASGALQSIGTEDASSGLGYVSQTGRAVAYWHIQELFNRQPNVFNNESVLFRIKPTIGRGSSKVTTVGNLEHSRYLRINFYNPEQIISLGADDWKVYPMVRKNISNPNGDPSSTDHSGTIGLAISYDGA